MRRLLKTPAEFVLGVLIMVYFLVRFAVLFVLSVPIVPTAATLGIIGSVVTRNGEVLEGTMEWAFGLIDSVIGGMDAAANAVYGFMERAVG